MKIATLALVLMMASATLSIPASLAQGDRMGARTVVRTWLVRWPAKHRSRYWVLQMPEPLAGARSGHIYINGFQVDTSFTKSADFIVACAHRDPAFASGTLHLAAGTIYTLVVLTSGGCTPPGASVAGTLTRVKVVLTLY